MVETMTLIFIGICFGLLADLIVENYKNYKKSKILKKPIKFSKSYIGKPFGESIITTLDKKGNKK